MLKRPAVHWILAIVVTLAAVVYQRATGPTYPRRMTFSLGDSSIAVKLPRSHGGDGDCPVKLSVPDADATGKIRYRRYPTDEPWLETTLRRDGDELVGELPHQPPAGKLEYVVVLSRGDEETAAGESTATIIRFKGGVPGGFLIPHVLLMFVAMLISNVAGMKALTGSSRRLVYTWITVATLFLGGLVLGPIVQKYAFGDFWTGVPFGWDLTDNKLAIGFLFWLGALLANLKKRRPIWIVIAAVVLLAIYSIPHSAMGSELDPATGKVITG